MIDNEQTFAYIQEVGALPRTHVGSGNIIFLCLEPSAFTFRSEAENIQPFHGTKSSPKLGMDTHPPSSRYRKNGDFENRVGNISAMNNWRGILVLGTRGMKPR